MTHCRSAGWDLSNVSELYRTVIASEPIGENNKSSLRHDGKSWYRIAKTKIVMIVMSDPNSCGVKRISLRLR